MTTCYVCTAHGTNSLDPEAVACCSVCGVFACIWDGARLHGKGAYECAFCMVRVLIESAERANPPDGPGGGGIGAEASFREFLSTEAFERDCARLASASRGQREAWRDLLLQQLPAETRAEFAARLAALAGRDDVEVKIEVGLAAQTVDASLLADAAGVGEYAYRLEATGPATLASVARAEDAERARQELERKAADAAATPVRAKSIYTPQKEEPKEVLKTMTMGQRRES